MIQRWRLRSRTRAYRMCGRNEAKKSRFFIFDYEYIPGCPTLDEVVRPEYGTL